MKCNLIDGCDMRSNDLNRIQVALGEAGLNDFEITSSNVLVPRGKRNVYLKAVADGNALPESFKIDDEDSVAVNPFLSRGQQEQIEQSKKKKQVREMVTKLPFVEQAWFEMDRVKASSAFQDEKRTAVVLIQPTGKLLLDSDKIETIRGLISGAIAGIPSETIVVTDLNAGIAHQDSQTVLGTPKTAGASYQTSVADVSSPAIILDQKHRYENEIRNTLADFEDVEIEVDVFPSRMTTVQIPDLDPPRMDQSSRSPKIVSVGTNGQASITAQPRSEPRMALKPVSVNKVKVQITLPESQLLAALPESKTTTLPVLRRQKGYLNLVSEIKNDIVSRLRPILPISSFSSHAEFPITVSIQKEKGQSMAQVAGPTEVELWLKSMWDRIGGAWGAIGVILACGLIVSFIFSGPKRQEDSTPMAEKDETEPVLSVVSNENEAAAETPEGAIKQEISKLIKEDPEAAAQVIKRWIRNAA